MGDKSGIEWTDATWNPVAGCSLVSPGCTNCYAMKQAQRCASMGLAKYAGLTQVVKGKAVWTGAVRLDEASLEQPLRWRRTRRIFVNSMSDLFHEALPDEAIDQVFAVMQGAPQHQFQILTKRPKRMRDYVLGGAPQRISKLEPGTLVQWPLPQVWLGVSVEDQARADQRIPLLLQTPAAIRFISAEPLLGPLDLWLYLDPMRQFRRRLDLVICGGESGPGARAFDIQWARDLIEQCQAATVAVFMKQLGRHPYEESENAHAAFKTGLKDRKGGDMAEWPPDLRVREMPL